MRLGSAPRAPSPLLCQQGACAAPGRVSRVHFARASWQHWLPTVNRAGRFQVAGPAKHIKCNQLQALTSPAVSAVWVWVGGSSSGPDVGVAIHLLGGGSLRLPLPSCPPPWQQEERYGREGRQRRSGEEREDWLAQARGAGVGRHWQCCWRSCCNRADYILPPAAALEALVHRRGSINTTANAVRRRQPAGSWVPKCLLHVSSPPFSPFLCLRAYSTLCFKRARALALQRDTPSPTQTLKVRRPPRHHPCAVTAPSKLLCLSEGPRVRRAGVSPLPPATATAGARLPLQDTWLPGPAFLMRLVGSRTMLLVLCAAAALLHALPAAGEHMSAARGRLPLTFQTSRTPSLPKS